MKYFLKVLDLLIWVIPVAVTTAVFICVLKTDLYINLGEILEKNRLLVGISSGTLVAISLSVLIKKILQFDADHNITFKTDDGAEAVISVGSVEKCLKTHLEAEADINKASVQMNVDKNNKGPIGCTAFVSVDERINIPKRTKEICSLIRGKFIEMLPIEGELKVTVKLMLQPTKKKKAAYYDYDEGSYIPPYRSGFQYNPTDEEKEEKEEKKD